MSSLANMAIVSEIRYGFRSLRQAPGFACAAVCVLALGIGATTSVFSLLDALLLRPLPFRDAHQLVMLTSRSPRGEAEPVSMLDFLDFAEQSRTFARVAGVVGISQLSVMGEGGELPESAALQTVTRDFFDVLGVSPLAGRVFGPADEAPGATIGFVMSERYWRTRFGADPNIVGRTIRVGSPPRPIPIVGVVPADFRFLGVGDLWEYLPISRRDVTRGQGVLRVVARLKPDVTVEQARADAELIAERIAAASPATNKGRSAIVEPLQTAIVGDDLRTTTLVLAAVVVVLLLLACANIANLILARGVGRVRELAVRAALGGTQSRLARQILTESLVLGVLGGMVGLTLATMLLQAAPVLLPSGMFPEPIVLRVDWRVATFALTATLLTALLFGLVPAWHAARVSLVDAMAAGGRGSSDRSGRARHALAAVQIAMALLLMTGAGLLVRSLTALTSTDAGYRSDNVVTLGMRLPFRVLTTAKPGDLGRYWHRMEEEVATVAGVRVAAFASDVPLAGPAALGAAEPFQVVGAPEPEPSLRPTARYHSVTPGYFTALGIPIVRGRGFSAHDLHDSEPVAIVNEEFARRHLAGREPLGARVLIRNPLSFRSSAVARQVVGVVRQVKSLPEEPAENALQIFVPLAQNNWLSPTLVVRASEDPLRLVPQIKAAIARVDPTQTVSRIRTMDMVLAEATARPRLRAQVASLFAVIATTLAATGIFSVLALMVQQRSREFSVRLAVGASATALLRLVFGSALKVTAVGLAAGLVAALIFARALEGVLFGVTPSDAVTFIAAPALLGLIALLACLAPAVRALRTDPVAALRGD